MRVICGKAKGTKLNSIDSLSTRPTLDRVKESLFNILQSKIESDIVVLDLFAGSGAIGIEFLSRGAKKVYFCENSLECSKMLYQNLEKTRFLEESIVLRQDYKKCLEKLAKEKVLLDAIYIDPPYKKNIAIDSIKRILSLDLLKEDGLLIIETDEEERELKEIEKISVNVCDLRKYGRISLIFLNRKG